MNFAWSELQLEIRALAAQLLRDHAGPEQLSALEASGERLDRQLWAELKSAGLTAIPLPETAGGAGLGFQEAGLVFEQLGAHVAPVPLVGHTLAAMALQRASGDELAASQLEGEGWLACSTRREGNTLRLDDGRLSGQLGAIAHGEGSDAVVLPARQGDDWFLCLVKRDAVGLSWQAQVSTGLEPRGLLQADSAPVEILGDAAMLAWLEQRQAAAHCMAQVGVVDAALQLAREHVCEREQFGVKIGSFQAVAHRMADAWTDMMNLRMAAEAAVVALDQQEDAELAVRSAQAWSAEAGHRVLASAQHVHGGLGHDKDYPLWRYAVWARQYEMESGGLGHALEQLGRCIARDPEAALL
jgi:alkylation response protein AidB-like acyl-CoA dehydrogenase